MNIRENLLKKAWTSAPMEIGGKPVVLSPVRYAILEQWGNELFVGGDNPKEPIVAMAEVLLVCTVDQTGFKDLMKLSDNDRKRKVIDFMVNNEDEISAAAMAGMKEHMEPIKAAMVESEAMGKEEQAHAS